ncbi:MAG: hypothetical protein M0Z96_01495 [Actinomycetota bacterium]|nr:hypothetical protein [Actinomycetota bacterium]
MFSDSTPVLCDYRTDGQILRPNEMPPRTLGNVRARPFRLIVALAITFAALLELRSWQTVAHPYASAPASCNATPTPRRAKTITSVEFMQAAVNSYNALQVCFGGPKGSFRGPFVGLAAAWPESQALSALLYLANVPNAPASVRSGIVQRMSVLKSYWDRKGGYFPSGRWFSSGRGVKKYDDNAWLGLDLIDAYLITHKATYLDQARAVATFETTGWSRNEHFADPGGLYWQQSKFKRHRNAVSTAGAALLNGQLYAVTGIKLYRNRAEQYLHWTTSALTLKNGLIGDQISTHGVVNNRVWSYNQGLVIAANVSLYNSTKNPAYLAAARHLAHKSLFYLNYRNRLEEQPQVFDAIYFRSLMSLNAIAPDARYLRALRSYATYLYDRMVPSTGVVHLGPMTTASTGWLLTQAAATQVFTLMVSTSHTLSA